MSASRYLSDDFVREAEARQQARGARESDSPEDSDEEWYPENQRGDPNAPPDDLCGTVCFSVKRLLSASTAIKHLEQHVLLRRLRSVTLEDFGAVARPSSKPTIDTSAP